MSDKLRQAIETVIDESQRLGVEAFEDALMMIEDDMTIGERSDDAYTSAVIDGVRWGARAAVTVDLCGGAMMRVVMPEGARITHEWADHNAADPQIKAALAAVMDARVTAQGVGDE